LKVFLLDSPGAQYVYENIEIWSLDSNEFLSKSLWFNIAETFLASLYIQRVATNPLFEAISLHGPTGLLGNKNFLASRFLFSIETFALALLKARGPLGPYHT
jgi:hypothetical protein